MRMEWLPLVVLSSLAGSAFAGEPLTPEKAVQRRQIAELVVSPSGDRAVVVVVEPPDGRTQGSDLWVVDLPSRRLWQLTTSKARDEHPRFSPDGETIAFASERGEKTQIHLISLRGGEARAITASETDASAPSFSPDGRTIAFLAAVPPTADEKKKRERDDDSRVADLDDRPPQLWLVDVATGSSRRLTSGRWRISDFVWEPDGRALILAASDHPQPELFTTALYRLEIPSSPAGDPAPPREIARPAGPFGELEMSPDGRTLCFIGSRGDGPDPHDLYALSLGTSTSGTPRNLTSDSIDRPVDHYQWEKDGTLAVEVEDGFSSRFFSVALDGKAVPRERFTATHPLGPFGISESGALFVGESGTALPELWLSTAPGKAERLSSFNAGFADIDLVEPRLVSYPSADGTTIEAALLRPPGSGPVPAVVLVHGGPTGRWSLRFHDWGQLLVAKGMAVLYPNIRGSTGYGRDFLVANRRDWGGGDFQDVLAGARYLVDQGIADPEKMGIGGWSYGGYMAAWAVTQTDRFRAAVSGAPMTNLVSEYGTERDEINSYDTWFLGSPYRELDLFRDRSPLTHVREAKTPTLILCGENDVTDPIGQCTEFYRGLKRYKTTAELVIYPREGHGFREQRHREDVLRRIVDWFGTYLGENGASTASR